MRRETDRISFFLPSLRGGGAERVTATLASELARLGLLVDLITATGLGINSKWVTGPVRLIDLAGTRTSLSTVRLARYLRQEAPRVLVSAVDNANVVAQAAIRLAGHRTRHVCTVHIAMKTAARLLGWRRDTLLLRLAAKLYCHCDAIVAVSKGAADEYRDLASKCTAPVTVIYNPVITPTLLARARESDADANVYWRGGPLVVGMGRLTPQKDFGMFIRAVAIARKARPDLRALIIGEGEERLSLERLVAALEQKGYVDLCGYLENPYPIVDKASVFALSSKWEALPTVLIEALALGPSLIATDCQSGPREILENGKYGRLTAVGDAPQFAEAMLEALGEGRQARSAEAWRRFTPKVAAQQYVQLLEHL